MGGLNFTLFDWSYWIGGTALGFQKGDTCYFLCAFICFVGFFVTRYMLVRFKKHLVARIFYSPFPLGFLLFALFALVLGFLHYQGIYLFSSRIWFLVYQVSFFIWFVPRVFFVFGYMRVVTKKVDV